MHLSLPFNIQWESLDFGFLLLVTQTVTEQQCVTSDHFTRETWLISSGVESGSSSESRRCSWELKKLVNRFMSHLIVSLAFRQISHLDPDCWSAQRKCFKAFRALVKQASDMFFWSYRLNSSSIYWSINCSVQKARMVGW